MKKNKKLFLASIAAMGAVAIGTGAVSTFAWYGAAAATLSASQTASGTISTTALASTDTLNIDLQFTLTMNSGVEPTDETTGFVYVISNGVVTKAANQTGLNRWGTNGALAFSQAVLSSDHTTKITAEDARWLNNKAYSVYIKSAGGDGQVRIAASTTGSGEAERVVNDATSNSNKGVLLGHITFHADGENDPTATYKNASNSGDALTAYYYAYNPVTHGDAGDEEAADAYNATPSITGITITLVAD